MDLLFHAHRTIYNVRFIRIRSDNQRVDQQHADWLAGCEKKIFGAGPDPASDAADDKKNRGAYHEKKHLLFGRFLGKIVVFQGKNEKILDFRYKNTPF